MPKMKMKKKSSKKLTDVDSNDYSSSIIKKKKMSFNDALSIYVQGGFPLIVVDTPEIDRANDALYNFATEWEKTLLDTNAPKEIKIAGFSFYVWDCNNGFKQVISTDNGVSYEPYSSTESGFQAIEFIMSNRAKAGLYVLQNFHMLWKNEQEYPAYVQYMRDLANKCKEEHKHIVILGYIDKIPAEIRPIIVPVEFGLPDKEEIREFITDYVKELPHTEDISDKMIEEAASASTGMTLLEVEGAICVAITQSKGESIDKDIIFTEKAKAVQKSGLLELIRTEETISTVGGLINLKYWFDRVAKAFTDRPKAEKYGLPYPKGCLLTGVQGCLSGDTEIIIKRGNKKSGRVYTMEQAYKRFNSIKSQGYNRYWDKSIKSYTLSLKDDVIGLNEIDSIVYSGEKVLYELITESGNSIKATDEHPFKVPEGTKGSDEEGFTHLGNLKVGDYVVIRDNTKCVPEKRTYKPRRTINEKVKSIKKIGLAPTYDLVMKSPYRNYIANGFVVHNSGKTLCAKAVASFFEAPLFRVDVGKLFGSGVGDTERNTRELLQLMVAVSPAVFLFDEIIVAL